MGTSRSVPTVAYSPAVSTTGLSEIDQGAVIEHKRLSHVLRVAQELQAQRDSRRSPSAPSRTHRGVAVRKPKRLPGTKKQRELSQTDLNNAIMRLAQSAPSP